MRTLGLLVDLPDTRTTLKYTFHAEAVEFIARAWKKSNAIAIKKGIRRRILCLCGKYFDYSGQLASADNPFQVMTHHGLPQTT